MLGAWKPASPFERPACSQKHIHGQHLLTHAYTAGPAVPPVSLHTHTVTPLTLVSLCVCPCPHTQTVLEVAPSRRRQLLRPRQRTEGGFALTLHSMGRAPSHATVSNHACKRPCKLQQCMHACNGCSIYVADPVTCVCVCLLPAPPALGHVLSPYRRVFRHSHDHLRAE